MVNKQYTKARMRVIRESNNFMLSYAMDRGMQGSYNYYPHTPELKEAYEIGLSEWLDKVHIEGIEASEISNPIILKGFQYQLIANKILSFEVHPDHSYIDQSKVFQDGIDKTLRQLEVLSKFNPEIEKEKEDFEKGLRLADEYLQGGLLYNWKAISLYGLNLNNLPENKTRKVRRIHRDLNSRLNILIGTGKDEYLSPAIGLYRDKSEELSEYLMKGDLTNANETCDYLEMIVRFIEIGDPNPEFTLNPDHSNGDSKNSKQNKKSQQNIRQEILQESSMFQDVNRYREDILKRMKSLSYDLEQRMNELVRNERYEEADKIRDELKILRK